MPRQTLEQIAKSIELNKDAARKSLAWFDEQVKILGNRVSRNSLMQGKGKTGNIMPGKMYFYFYDPITKDKLPYYDTFPLVLPFSRDATTFTGINFHYLPYKVRTVLLKNLLDFASDKKMDENTKIKTAWQYIGGISRYRGVNSAVKKYRFDHVQSPFLEVPASSWFTALLLPVQSFNTGTSLTYVNPTTVWRDSLSGL